MKGSSFGVICDAFDGFARQMEDALDGILSLVQGTRDKHNANWNAGFTLHSEERKDLKCVVVVVAVVRPSVPIEFPRKFIVTSQHFNLYLTSVFY